MRRCIFCCSRGDSDRYFLAMPRHFSCWALPIASHCSASGSRILCSSLISKLQPEGEKTTAGTAPGGSMICAAAPAPAPVATSSSNLASKPFCIDPAPFQGRLFVKQLNALPSVLARRGVAVLFFASLTKQDLPNSRLCHAVFTEYFCDDIQSFLHHG